MIRLVWKCILFTGGHFYRTRELPQSHYIYFSNWNDFFKHPISALTRSSLRSRKPTWRHFIYLIFCSQVMMQKHNRHMSFSLYISILAVTDTICLLIGELNVLLVEVSCWYANDMLISYTYISCRHVAIGTHQWTLHNDGTKANHIFMLIEWLLMKVGKPVKQMRVLMWHAKICMMTT